MTHPHHHSLAPSRPTREEVDDALRRTVPTSVAPPLSVDVFTLAAEVRALRAELEQAQRHLKVWYDGYQETAHATREEINRLRAGLVARTQQPAGCPTHWIAGPADERIATPEPGCAACCSWVYGPAPLPAVPDGEDAAVLDAAHFARQAAFSAKTFGPGPRTAGVLDHIRKELVEIEAAPSDLGEWVDVMILAADGAWRAGHEPQAIVDAVIAKQRRNEARVWPDWRTAEPGKAIEHDRSTDAALAIPTGEE